MMCLCLVYLVCIVLWMYGVMVGVFGLLVLFSGLLLIVFVFVYGVVNGINMMVCVIVMLELVLFNQYVMFNGLMMMFVLLVQVSVLWLGVLFWWVSGGYVVVEWVMVGVVFVVFGVFVYGLWNV